MRSTAVIFLAVIGLAMAAPAWPDDSNGGGQAEIRFGQPGSPQILPSSYSVSPLGCPVAQAATILTPCPPRPPCY